jgi:ribonuclease HII
MAVLVGIDEAGFGPILGPLVVSSSVFSVRSNLLGADLWQVLSKSVSNRKKRLAGRLLIADSKKAYSRRGGIKHLERTVLSCLRCLDKSPETLSELLSLLCPECVSRLADYPWYKQADDFNSLIDEADIEIASAVFKEDLSNNGIELLELGSCCLDVAYYNELVDKVKNKAGVLFGATSQLIRAAFDKFGGDDLQIVIDRQGGRVRYRKSLLRSFEGMELIILKESPKNSSYELREGNETMRLHFAVGADDRFLPVSLASMVSKFIRELLVHNINHYFVGFDAGLKPTAGYWKDGLRFIRDLQANIGHVKYDSNQLIRCR